MFTEIEVPQELKKYRVQTAFKLSPDKDAHRILSDCIKLACVSIKQKVGVKTALQLHSRAVGNSPAQPMIYLIQAHSQKEEAWVNALRMELQNLIE